MEKRKNLIVSFIYGTPGTKIEIFKDNIEDLFKNLNQKGMFICGDFNIDLLNPNQRVQHEYRE